MNIFIYLRRDRLIETTQPEHQIWLCEIKMKENDKAMGDLKKFKKDWDKENIDLSRNK